jgi:succinyl-CoA synthetase beta subunit
MGPTAAPSQDKSMTTLSEARSSRLVAEYGVPVLPQRTAATADDAVIAAAALGFPVVVKLGGDSIAHKTERGLVRLDLADEPSVHHAATDLLQLARADDGDVELLIAPMVRGTRELIAGVHTDEQFGLCVMLGFGGILAEAIADVSFRLVPLDPLDAEEMIEDLRTQTLLGPFRGEPAVDRTALVAALLGLSRLAASEPNVVAVDVNPLIVVDGRPVAVDALVEISP